MACSAVLVFSKRISGLSRINCWYALWLNNFLVPMTLTLTLIKGHHQNFPLAGHTLMPLTVYTNKHGPSVQGQTPVSFCLLSLSMPQKSNTWHLLFAVAQRSHKHFFVHCILTKAPHMLHKHFIPELQPPAVLELVILLPQLPCS